MGDLGKLTQLRFDLRDPVAIKECMIHSDVVYNLIGRNYETKNFSFDGVHLDGARRIARIAKEAGVQKFIHISALNANINSSSGYLRSKAMGEIAVLEEFPDATIVRPAWVYGHQDQFFNKIGWFANWFPFSAIFAPDGGHALMRPVLVNDVAAALSIMAHDDSTTGKIVELYGPKVYTYASLIELFQDAAMRQHRTIPIPKSLLKPMCRVWSALLAYPIMSPDEVERLTISEILSKDASTFEDFGIAPYSVEETINRFIQMFRGSFSNAPFATLVKDYTFKNNS